MKLLTGPAIAPTFQSCHGKGLGRRTNSSLFVSSHCGIVVHAMQYMYYFLREHAPNDPGAIESPSKPRYLPIAVYSTVDRDTTYVHAVRAPQTMGP